MKARFLTLAAAAAVLGACGSGSDAGQQAGDSVDPGATGTLPSRAEQVQGGTTPVDTLTADPSTTPGAGSPVAGSGSSTTGGAGGPGGSGAPAGTQAPAATPAPAGQPTRPASATEAPNAPDAMVTPAAKGDTTGHTGHTP